MSTSNADAFIVLKGGFVAPVEVLKRLWLLEDKGVDFGVDAEGLRAGPRDLLTDDDRAFLHSHRDDAIRIVQYVAEAEA